MKDKVFTVDNIWFILIIAIITLWLTFVTTKGSLTNNTYTRKWWKRLTKRGLIAGFLLISLGIVLLLQEYNNKRIAYNSEIDLKNEQNLRNKKIVIGVNDGVEKQTDILYTKLSIAFKKQGLKFDSIKNEVVKLKDSIKVINNHGPKPVVAFASLKIKDSVNFDKTYYIIETVLTSLETTATNTNLKTDIFAITSNDDIITLKRNVNTLYKGQDLVVNRELTNEIAVPKDLLYTVYIFRLKGSYWQNHKTESKIDNLYLLWPRQKTNMLLEIPNYNQENAIRSYIKKNKYN